MLIGILEILFLVFIVIVCNDIFSILSEQDLAFAFEQLYEFEVSKWNILFVLVGCGIVNIERLIKEGFKRYWKSRRTIENF